MTKEKSLVLQAFDEVVLYLNATDIKGECEPYVKVLYDYLHKEE